MTNSKRDEEEGKFARITPGGCGRGGTPPDLETMMMLVSMMTGPHEVGEGEKGANCCCHCWF